MSSTTVLSLRIHPDVKQKLERIADAKKLSSSSLAAAALTAYAEEAIGSLEGVKGCKQQAPRRATGRGKNHDQ